MNLLRIFIFFAIVCGGLQCSFAQSFSGTYTGTYQSDPVHLALQIQGQSVSGSLNDGTSTFAVAAYAEGNYLVGTATDSKSGVQLILAAELKGNALDIALTADGVNHITLNLQRSAGSSSNPQVATPNKGSSGSASFPQNPYPQSNTSSKGSVEPRLVGTWIKTINNNTGYGSGAMYFTTEVRFQINADGSFDYGSSRSVGGGSEWSYDGSQWSAPQMSGTLRSDGSYIYVLQANGQPVPAAQQRMGSYYIDGYNMSTTGNDGVKEYWQKR